MARRREAEMLDIVNQKSRFESAWKTAWSVIYFTVGLLTYLSMLVCFILTFYYIGHDDPIRAVLYESLTVLSIYINKVNPS